MPNRIRSALLIITAYLTAAAASASSSSGFKVVGYMPFYQGDVSAIQYSKLTHVILSFAYPQDNGSIININAAKVNQTVALAHAAGTKVFLALGGGGNGDKGWIAATGSETSRRALTDACMKAVRDYNLDGIDFDWEYPDGAQVAGFNAAVKMLAAELHKEGKEISAAVTYNDWPRSFPNDELFAHFDFLNIMVYDNPTPHATMAHARTAISTWITNKKLPKEKFVLGCPFYSSAGQAYRSIVAANPQAAWVDSDGAEDYNSIPTIRKKTQLALDQGGGIMFWELSHDATGALSLLSAVDAVVKATVSARGVIPVTAVGGSMDGRAGLTFTGGRLILSGGAAAGYDLLDAVGRRVSPERRLLLP